MLSDCLCQNEAADSRAIASSARLWMHRYAGQIAGVRCRPGHRRHCHQPSLLVADARPALDSRRTRLGVRVGEAHLQQRGDVRLLGLR